MSLTTEGAQRASIERTPQPIRTKKRKLGEDNVASKTKKNKHTHLHLDSAPVLVTTDSPSSSEQRKTNKNAKKGISSRKPTQNSSITESPKIQDETFYLPAAKFTSHAPVDSKGPSPFHTVRLSLYLPLPAISLSSGISSLLSTHLSPLLLTYFLPTQGIVLAFSDPVLSAKPGLSSNLPLVPPYESPDNKHEGLAITGDEFGVSWIWLTATFVVFRPEKDVDMPGYINTTSEGFIGLVSYNYFQAGVNTNRIPAAWKWIGPERYETSNRKKKGKKGKIKDDHGQVEDAMDIDGDEQNPTMEVEEILNDSLGYFINANGEQVANMFLKFRVVDSEVVPAHDRERWSLTITGSLLSGGEENQVLKEDHVRFERTRNRDRQRMPAIDLSARDGTPMMSGGLD